MFDSIIDFTCNDSYVLYPEESRVVRCIELKDGAVKWNASFPECGGMYVSLCIVCIFVKPLMCTQ